MRKLFCAALLLALLSWGSYAEDVQQQYSIIWEQLTTIVQVNQRLQLQLVQLKALSDQQQQALTLLSGQLQDSGSQLQTASESLQSVQQDLMTYRQQLQKSQQRCRLYKTVTIVSVGAAITAATIAAIRSR